MIPLKAKLIAGVVLLALLAWAVHWLNSRLDRANEADALQQKYEGLVAGVAKRDEDERKQMAADLKTATTALQRLEKGQQALADIAQQPVKTVVYRETKSPDGTVCAQPAITADWMRNYNATAAAAAPAR